jgi:hypothetical protein
MQDITTAIAIPATNEKRVKFDAKKRVFYVLWLGDSSRVNVIVIVQLVGKLQSWRFDIIHHDLSSDDSSLYARGGTFDEPEVYYLKLYYNNRDFDKAWAELRGQNANSNT